MKSLSENKIVKFTFASINIFRILFLMGMILFFIVSLTFVNNKSIGVSNFDFFKFFDKNSLIYHSDKNNLVIYSFVVNVLIALGILAILNKIKMFFKNVFENNPFIEVNGKYLKTVGIIGIACVFLHDLTNAIFIQNQALEKLSIVLNILTRAATLLMVIFNPYFLMGMFIFVLGEIIIHAAELKQENDLTV